MASAKWHTFCLGLNVVWAMAVQLSFQKASNHRNLGLYIYQLLQANNKENIEILALCEANRRMSGEIFSQKAANAENLFVS